MVVKAKKRQKAGRRPRSILGAPRVTPSEAAADIGQVVSRNLKRLRVARGFTLEALAKMSGVSRGMLSQIELGRSVPTIALLWKVTFALGARFAELTSERASAGTTIFSAENAKVLVSPDGSFTSRALFPYSPDRRVEFYKITLMPRAIELSDPHPGGTIENLIVAAGKVQIEVGEKTYKLNVDDAMVFDADVAHKYVNIGPGAAVMYIVLAYVDAAAARSSERPAR